VGLRLLVHHLHHHGAYQPMLMRSIGHGAGCETTKSTSGASQ
jgi:hypothetical protein